MVRTLLTAGDRGHGEKASSRCILRLPLSSLSIVNGLSHNRTGPPAVATDRGTLTVNTERTELQLMTFDHEGPGGANFRNTSAPKAVNWEDRDEARRWLLRLLEVVKDLRGVARARSGQHHP